MERKETGSEISSIDIAPIPPGRLRQRFLAVGGGADNTVRILSLDPDDCLQARAPASRPRTHCARSPASLTRPPARPFQIVLGS